jgi:hypothetical protein
MMFSEPAKLTRMSNRAYADTCRRCRFSPSTPYSHLYRRCNSGAAVSPAKKGLSGSVVLPRRARGCHSSSVSSDAGRMRLPYGARLHGVCRGSISHCRSKRGYARPTSCSCGTQAYACAVPACRIACRSKGTELQEGAGGRRGPRPERRVVRAISHSPRLRR